MFFEAKSHFLVRLLNSQQSSCFSLPGAVITAVSRHACFTGSFNSAEYTTSAKGGTVFGTNAEQVVLRTVDIL